MLQLIAGVVSSPAATTLATLALQHLQRVAVWAMLLFVYYFKRPKNSNQQTRILFSAQVLLCHVQLVVEVLFGNFNCSCLHCSLFPHLVLHAAFECPRNSDRICSFQLDYMAFRGHLNAAQSNSPLLNDVRQYAMIQTLCRQHTRTLVLHYTNNSFRRKINSGIWCEPVEPSANIFPAGVCD